jgi:hypothetical protein
VEGCVVETKRPPHRVQTDTVEDASILCKTIPSTHYPLTLRTTTVSVLHGAVLAVEARRLDCRTK